MLNYSRKPSRSYSCNAFTLIELLTVIAIIGILAAILVPTVSKVRQMAKNTQCISNLREWGRAIMFYVQDHKGNYAIQTDSKHKWGTINDYKNSLYGSYLSKGSTNVIKYRWCPADPDFNPNDPFTTGVTYTMAKGFQMRGNSKVVPPDDAIPLDKANTPSKLLLMIDSVRNDINIPGDIVTNISGATKMVFPLMDNAQYKGRHGKSVNALFGDGHVEAVHKGAPTTPSSSSISYNLFVGNGEIWLRIQ